MYHILINEKNTHARGRYKMCFPKAHKLCVVKPVSETKSYNYMSGLISEVIKWFEEGNAVAQPLPVQLPKNIAIEPALGKYFFNSQRDILYLCVAILYPLHSRTPI